jgi:hypothetical protein
MVPGDCEFSEIEFAEEDSTRIRESVNYGCTGIGSPVAQNAAGARRENSFRETEILNRDRDPMERAAPFACADFLIGLSRTTQRGVIEHGQIRMELRIEPMNSIKDRSSDFHRSELAGAKERSQFIYR